MYVRVRRHDLAASADRRPADRWAGLVSRVDPAPKAKHDELIAEAEARVAEAQQKRSELLQELGSERSLLQKEIEELRTFERSHRAHLKSHLEGKLIELEQIGGPETG